MKPALAVAAFLLAITGQASADIPLLNATCPTGIEVHADSGGPFYINGNEASTERFGDSYYEARSEGISVELMMEPGGSVSLTYTAPGGANGVCQISEVQMDEAGGCPADVSEADRYKYPACN